MRKSSLVASVALALLAPALAAAQMPVERAWIFEVPFNLETLNQDVTEVTVGCVTHATPPDPRDPRAPGVGGGFSDPITLDASGNRSGVTMVPVTAWGGDPGRAKHYICSLILRSPDGMAVPETDHFRIEFRARNGTQLIPVVTGTLP